MTKKNGRYAAGAAVAAFALVGVTACSGGAPAVPNLPTNLPSIPGVGDPKAAFGNAHQSALGLAGLGGLGVAQGVGDQVKELAPQVQSEGQGIDQKLRGLASAVGVSLPDQLSPEQQAQLDDIKGRTGEQFDQGWLQAAQAEQAKLKEQANGLLNIPGLPEDQKAQAQQQLANLDQLGKKLDEAAAAAARPPRVATRPPGATRPVVTPRVVPQPAVPRVALPERVATTVVLPVRVARPPARVVPARPVRLLRGQEWPGGRRRHRWPGRRLRRPGPAHRVRWPRPGADRRRRDVAAPLQGVSDRRRRPGTRGALFLLLLGVIFLGAGVLAHLYDSDDREVVAQDLGSLPGSLSPGTRTAASRPLAEAIRCSPAWTICSSGPRARRRSPASPG